MVPSNEPTREETRIFLEGLRDCLNEKWPPDEVKKKMEEYEGGAKSKNPKLRNVPHETLFLSKIVVPTIHGYLKSNSPMLSKEDACKALLAEGYRSFKDVASGSPMSADRYPFTKQFSAGDTLFKSWWDSTKKSRVCNACPDFALRFPCPYKVVGEVKYFRERGAEAARKELVRSIYQCFFYRGLPSWDYDYACLLAYDASGNESLANAWKGVCSDVKDACWKAANIFVMILPSQTLT